MATLICGKRPRKRRFLPACLHSDQVGIGGHTFFEQHRQCIQHQFDHRFDAFPISLGKTAQHIIDHFRAAALRMTDPDADSVVAGRNRRVNRLQSVMSAGAAPELGLQPPGRQIHIVMNNDNMIRQNLIKGRRFHHRIAGQVHIGLGFQQINLFVADFAFGNQPVKLAAKSAETERRSNRIRRGIKIELI